MKKRLLSLLLLTALTFGSARAIAADSDVALSQTLQVLGRVNMAGIALVHGAKGEALAHVKSAHDVDDALAAATPRRQVVAPDDAISFARISFKTYEGSKDYFIPLADGDLVTRVFEDKFLKSKAPGVDITDADVVKASVSFDPAAALTALAGVDKSLALGRADDARVALENISAAAISPKRVAAPPLDHARDALTLARALLRDRAYKGAGLAVGNAKAALIIAQQADSALKSDPKMADLEQGLNALSDLIAEGHAAAARKAESLFPDLFKDISGFADRAPSYN